MFGFFLDFFLPKNEPTTPASIIAAYKRAVTPTLLSEVEHTGIKLRINIIAARDAPEKTPDKIPQSQNFIHVKPPTRALAYKAIKERGSTRESGSSAEKATEVKTKISIAANTIETKTDLRTDIITVLRETVDSFMKKLHSAAGRRRYNFQGAESRGLINIDERFDNYLFKICFLAANCSFLSK